MRRIYKFITTYSTEKDRIEELMWIPEWAEDDPRAANELYEELTTYYPATNFFIGRAIGGSDFILARSTSSNYIKEIEMDDVDFASSYKGALAKFLVENPVVSAIIKEKY